MKNKFLSFSVLLTATLAVSLTGCLRDKEYDDKIIQSDRPDNGIKIIEIAGPSDGYYQHNLEYKLTDTTFNLVTVKLASDAPASEDIKVNLILNNALVGDYNTATGNAYVVPAASIYNLPNALTVTIPRGSNVGYLVAKGKPSDFATGGPYAFGVAINSVTNSGYTVSGNFNKIVAGVGVKNKYDGKYDIRGFFVRTDLADYNGPFESEVEMITAGVSSVDMFQPDYGIVAQPFFATGSLAAFGNVGPRLTFDPATDKVTSIFNVTGAAGVPAMTLIGTTNRYDPATKTIYVQYYYNTNPANRIFRDTLVYTGPR